MSLADQLKRGPTYSGGTGITKDRQSLQAGANGSILAIGGVGLP